jgi:hypothetical protein
MARAIWTKYLQTASVKRPQRHSAYEGAAISRYAASEGHGVTSDVRS